MRNGQRILFLVVMTACGGPKDDDTAKVPKDTSVTNPTGVTTPTGVTGQTGVPTATLPVNATGDTGFWQSLQDDGHASLAHRSGWIGGSERVVLTAVFVEDDLAIKNLADCYDDEFVPCFDALPVVDDAWIAPSGPVAADITSTLDMGPVVSVGVYSAASVFGDTHYFDVQTEPWSAAAAHPLVLDSTGVWGAYNGTDEVGTGSPLGTVSPDPSDRIQPGETDTLAFRWASGTSGNVYLYFRAGTSASPQEERLYKLQDDGVFDLDLSTLGLSLGTDLVAYLWREIARDRVINGHHFRGRGLSEQRWVGEVVDFGGRTRLDPFLDCATAQVAPLLTAGGYFGSLSGAQSLLDPGFFSYNCTGRSAMGAEGLYRFELAPGEMISVDYDLLGADGSIYVVADCLDAGTCDRGVDDGVISSPERLEYVNSTSSTVQRFLVVDGHLDGQTLPGSMFSMDVFFSNVVVDSLPEDCAEAGVEPALGPGVYSVSLDAYRDDLVILATQCTQTETSGHDAMFRVEVGPGELIEVSTDEPGTELALLDDCTDPATCRIGSIGVPESIAWYNLGAVTETLTVVLDEDGDTRVPPLFDLAVTRTVPAVDLWPEDCSGAMSEAAQVPGDWSIPLVSYADDINPGAGFCASGATPGPDAVLPVSVAPGEYVYLWTETPGVSLWLSDDCTTASSCHNPDPAPGLSFVEHVNMTAAPQVVYLTVDQDGGSVLPALVDVHSVVALVPLASPATDCGSVGTAGVLGTGVVYGTLVGHNATLDPGATGCSGAPAPGGEALFRVELQPGEGIDASLPDPFGQHLYLVSDCSDPATCVVGALANPGPARVVWANTSGTVEQWTLVVDGGPGMSSPVYRLDTVLGPIAPLPDADTCADAALLSALGNGRWIGSDLGGLVDELNPGVSGCTARELSGPDAMVPIHLEPGEIVSIRSVGGDSLYAVTDCLDATTCVGASEVWAGQPRLALDNALVTPWDGFLVVDTEVSGGPYTLDVRLGPATSFSPSDTCTGAAAQVPLATGLHLGTGSLLGFTNFLNPALPGPSCTGARALGGEGILPLVLEPGESVEATVNQTGGDGSLYLLEVCGDVTTCVNGDDQWDAGGIGGDWPETVSHTNISGAQQTLYLVIDGYSSTGDFYAEIEIGL